MSYLESIRDLIENQVDRAPITYSLVMVGIGLVVGVFGF